MAAASPLLDRLRPVWRAVATGVVPEAAQLTPPEWADVDTIVTRAIAARPAREQRQLALFLRLLDWFPLLRYGRRLRSLDAPRRQRFFHFVQRSAPSLLRRGFWGVRTLAFMGYYGRPAAAAAIGYRADPRGWEARR